MTKKKEPQTPTATIALLTRNSQKHLTELLDAITQQKFMDYEILIIDSSSSDDTLKIAKKYPSRIVTIKPEDFGHGKTRNYAAKLAKGEFIVFLTHDSIPRHENWLGELLKPFSDPKVVGVYGRQVPRDNEKLLDKYFQASLYGDKKIVWKADNWRQGDNLFSDANSALRKSILLEHPYPNNIIVSEDYEWAARILKLNYHVVYSTTAQVTHSHSYNLRTLFKRNFDVGVSYKMIYGKENVGGFASKGMAIVKKEISHLHKSGHTLQIPNAILRDGVRFIAIQFGKREHVFSKEFKRDHLSAQKWYWK